VVLKENFAHALRINNLGKNKTLASGISAKIREKLVVLALENIFEFCRRVKKCCTQIVQSGEEY
jgi:hypothetical protein